MDYSLPGSSIHGIFQARILEWVAISSSRGSSPPRDWNRVSCVSCISRQILLAPSHLGSSSPALSPPKFFSKTALGLPSLQVTGPGIALPKCSPCEYPHHAFVWVQLKSDTSPNLSWFSTWKDQAIFITLSFPMHNPNQIFGHFLSYSFAYMSFPCVEIFAD